MNQTGAPNKDETDRSREDATTETTHDPWEERGFFRRFFARDEAYNGATEAVTIPEAEALIKFVSERGLDPAGTHTIPLLEAIFQFRSERNSAARLKQYSEILKQYSTLTAMTFPKYKVNGRTLRDTEQLFFGTFWIVALGVGLFVCAIGTEIMGVYFKGIDPASNLSPTEEIFFNMYFYAGRFLSPLFWGGLGASVYLAKSLADKASDQTFDSRRLQGHRTLIFLGAVFGVVVVEVFQIRPPAGTAGLENLAPNATAFLCGLGVKAVYAGFETLVDSAHDTIKRWGGQEDKRGEPKPGEILTPPSSSAA